MDGADVTEMGERVSAGIRRMNDIMPNIWGFFQFLAKNIWGFFRFLAKNIWGFWKQAILSYLAFLDLQSQL